MQTVSINICTLCTQCFNRCRYCLLSYDGKVQGADWERSCLYAARFHDWLKTNRSDLSFAFYFGYSMEHPRLTEAVEFLRKMGSPTGEFLQMDGMAMRSEDELKSLLTALKERGIRLLDFTFYGTQDYHDRFAARRGDYALMLSALCVANEIGLDCEIGYPLTRESAPLAADFLREIEKYRLKNLFFFVPHGEGRGKTMEDIRLTEEDVAALPQAVLAHLNRERYKPEHAWLREEILPPQKRVLTLVLTQENIARYEMMSPDQVISELENLDDAYYRAVPDFAQLAARYGDRKGNKIFSERDLYLYYQRKFIAQTGLAVHDMNDERQHFSRRF